jgi:hypothetical protein
MIGDKLNKDKMRQVRNMSEKAREEERAQKLTIII